MIQALEGHSSCKKMFCFLLNKRLHSFQKMELERFVGELVRICFCCSVDMNTEGHMKYQFCVGMAINGV